VPTYVSDVMLDWSLIWSLGKHITNNFGIDSVVSGPTVYCINRCNCSDVIM
jgi:hypothetical protein